MIRSLRVLFISILVLMIGVSIWASLEKNVLIGFTDLWSQRWGVATLADAYCGFLTFTAWVFYRETSWLSRILWFVVIMLFGNIAMSSYVLLVLARAGANARPEDILLRRTA